MELQTVLLESALDQVERSMSPILQHEVVQGENYKASMMDPRKA